MVNRLGLFVVAALALVGCDDFLGTVTGRIKLAPDARADGFSALEVHLDGTTGDAHDVEVSLAPFEFPSEFYVGGGCCGPDPAVFRLSAWLSNGTWEEPTAMPPIGAPHTETMVPSNWRDSGSTSIELVLEP
ncbi:MAG TPA: hypothetical protein VGM90_13935 [Kofleriaceae bacterium]|jgi:hypothetical protein